MLLELTSHPQKTNASYENQITQPNASKEPTQYDSPAHEHGRTAEPYPQSPTFHIIVIKNSCDVDLTPMIGTIHNLIMQIHTKTTQKTAKTIRLYDLRHAYATKQLRRTLKP